MKTVTPIILLLLLLTTSIFALSNKELAITIDLSGKQRMLTQKMTKEVFLIKSNINRTENIKKLTQSSQLFEKTLQGLIKGNQELQLVATKNIKIQKQLKKVASIWQPFYAEIQDILKNRDYNKSYPTIDTKSNLLLQEMDSAVKLYASIQEKKSEFLLAHDMNLAGKQRMLLEKMSKSLLTANQNDFKLSQKLFTQTLKGLFEGDSSLKLKGTNLPLITQQLGIIKQLWEDSQEKLQSAIESGKETKTAIIALENISIEMDKSIKLYTASLNRQQQRNEFSSLIKIHTSLEKMDKKTKALIEKLAQVERE
jgi:hypothetical protein